jgi:KaiC/GvpD/RAD55 family RecA-like ATPase
MDDPTDADPRLRLTDGGPPEDGAAPTPGGDPPRCDYCRLPIPLDPVTTDRDDTSYQFCSKTCRTAMEERDRVFTEYHGHRRITTGVEGLSRGLPQGLPRNAFVLLSGQAGTRKDAVLAELAWRRLQQDDPVVFVTFQEPPAAMVQTFLTLDWNVIPYVERGQLCFVDCFTYRMEDPDRMRDRLSDWNRHLHEVADAATATVRDPTDMGEVANKLDNHLSENELNDCGAVLIDSLTELGTLVQPIQAYDVVKDLRADVCKGRFVPIFAGATFRDDGEFPHDLSYMVDGVVDLELDGQTVEDTLIKRVRIRKMSGVLTIPRWTAYEYTAGEGMATFDPEAEIAAAEARREAAAEANEESGEDEATGDPEPEAGTEAADPGADEDDGSDDE